MNGNRKGQKRFSVRALQQDYRRYEVTRTARRLIMLSDTEGMQPPIPTHETY
jgi:hypothetical protein